jgi:hypothetical protein
MTPVGHLSQLKSLSMAGRPIILIQNTTGRAVASSYLSISIS